MKLGAYMIVKNEESCIAECLKSIQGLDEIVILDTGSTDRTPEIVKDFPVKYIFNEYKWVDNFSEARNKARTYTTADWLVVIDADEVFEGDIPLIKKTIADNPSFRSYKVDTVSLNTKQQHLSVRLHKNDKSIKWFSAAHNYLNVLGDMIMPTMAVHYGYSEAHKLDPDRTLRILSKSVKNDPSCTREKYYLAREYWYRKDYLQAIYWYRHYIETSNMSHPAEVADAYLMLARCYCALGQIDKSKDECLQAVKLNANFCEAWRLLAKLSGPGNARQFNKIANISTNEGLLFVREYPNKSKEMQGYYCDGMSFYGKKMPFPKLSDSSAPCFFLGLYFDVDYSRFANHESDRIVFWNGSDVQRLVANPKWLDIVKRAPAKHYCHNKQLADELWAVGIFATIQPIFFGLKDSYKERSAVAEKPTFFMCSHPGREEEYGVHILKELARNHPECSFLIYGQEGNDYKNVRYLGLMDETLMDAVVADHTGFLRMNQHDGMSQQVYKCSLMGIPYAISRDVKELGLFIEACKGGLVKAEKIDNVIDMSSIKDFLKEGRLG